MKKVLLIGSILGLAAGIFVFNFNTVFAASSGPNGGSTFTDDSSVGDVVWSNPGNATSSDNIYSTAALNSGSNKDSHYLKATGFGFNIPAGSTIDGIEVRVKRSATVASEIRDNDVMLVKNGVIGGTDKGGSSSPDWETTDATILYGSSSDKWGQTWSVSDINSTTTGFAIAAHHHNGGAASTARVDYITITVYYTPSAPSITTTSPLPNGKVGNVYSQTLSATGGTSPYTWSIISGSLPAGLSLGTSTGAITGTPTTAGGPVPDTFKATDSASASTTKVLSITIDKGDQTITFGALSTKTYGDPDFSVSATASSGLTPTFTTDSSGVCTVSGTTVHMVSIGSCTITAHQAGNSNYNAASDVSQSFTINKATPVITWANPADITYPAPLSGTQLNATADVAGSFAYTPPATTVLNAGTGQNLHTDFTPTDTDNYNLANKDVTINVNKADQTIAFDALTTKIYGDSDFSVSATADSGLSVNFTVSGDCTVSGTVVHLTGAGSCTITAHQGGNGNYNAAPDVPQSFSINKREITVTADTLTKTYGDPDPALTYQITSGSLVSGDSLSGALSRDPGENVGSYAITKGALTNGNYEITYTGANLTINKKPITVTADAKGKNYGDPDPALTYQITGGPLVSGDSFSGELTRAVGEDVGTYAIKQGTLALSDNYYLTYVGAELTISQFVSVITVTAEAKSKTYGDSNPALTYTFNPALQDGDTFSGSLERALGEDVGSYAINQGSLTAGPNYNISFTGAELTINKRAITVTADSQSKVYGDTDPTLTHQITSGSLVDGDSLTGVLTRDAGENVGAYAITRGTLSAGGNYNLTFVGANLTITAKGLTITADNQTKTFGQTLTFNGNEFTSNGLVNEDSVTSVTLTSTGADSSAVAGTYDIIPSAAVGSSGLDNYTITYTNGMLTVNEKLNPVITWGDPADITYPTPLSSIQLNATSSVEGTFVYNPAAGTVLYAGNGQKLSVEFTPTDAEHYNPVSAKVSINVIAPAQNGSSILLVPEDTLALCSDNNDNDRNGLTDLADPNCTPFIPVVLGTSTSTVEETSTSTVGEVLGTSTECLPPINQFLYFGGKNDPAEVTKLQEFLNSSMGANLTVNGIFDLATLQAVKDFQLRFKILLLRPWVQYGHPDENTPTGNVFKLTRWLINVLRCPSSGQLMPTLP